MNINHGIGDRSSSRVLKPPGGGHSDIFGAPDVCVNKPRPKYDQQNSSNLNAICGTTDPNIKVLGEGAPTQEAPVEAPAPPKREVEAPPKQAPADTGRNNRVPPGGFSSGLW